MSWKSLAILIAFVVITISGNFALADCPSADLSEPQQQSRQPEQQQRISCCLALSVDIDNQARNRTVYGLSERGFGSPGSIPELWFSEVCCRSRIYAVRLGGAGRFYTERPI